MFYNIIKRKQFHLNIGFLLIECEDVETYPCIFLFYNFIFRIFALRNKLNNIKETKNDV